VKKIVMAVLFPLTLAGCYVPSGVYRLTEARFNGIRQSDDDCDVMIVKDNELICTMVRKNESR